jgi:hypothetical protein
MRIAGIIMPLLMLAPSTFADLTQQQKVSDFMQLVALYDVNYAPYQLKIQLYNFDLLKIQPWLAQIAQSKTDVDFYDICVQYVASLQDSHDEFTILSDYAAWMHLDGDIYDGKFLIDYIDRKYLPSKTYPFTIGDELISVDGVAVADLLKKLAPYSVNGSANPVSRQRIAAGTITERYQGWYPLAAVGPTTTIVVLHSDGTIITSTIKWDVQGTLVTTAGIVPTASGNQIGSNQLSQDAQALHAARRVGLRTEYRRGIDPPEGAKAPNPWMRTTDPSYQASAVDPTPDPAPPEYMAPLTALGNMKAASAEFAISGSGLSPFDGPFPVFNPPAGFKLRLGAGSADQFLSGTFPVGKANIGFIRIPSFAPSSTTAAVNQFSTEIQYFQANTDAIVIDLMANGGGSLCYGQTLASYLIPFSFQAVSEQLRATLTWQVSFSSARFSAIRGNAPSWIPTLYSVYLTAIEEALTWNRGMTGPLPLCSSTLTASPATSTAGKVLAYTKPILVLTDNFTLSTAESFTMQLQDNKRATIFGMRTDGGGGNVVGYSQVTDYSQGNTRVTEGLLQRLTPVAANGFPALPFYDSVGIQPDIPQDYMTAKNLSSGGADFVAAAIAAVKMLTGQ